MNANGRRAKQARMNNAHLSGMGIPRHRKPDSAVQAAKSAARLQAERERKARGAKA